MKEIQAPRAIVSLICENSFFTLTMYFIRESISFSLQNQFSSLQ